MRGHRGNRPEGRAPARHEPTAILDGLLPPPDRDVVRAALLKHFASTTYTTKDDQRCLGGTSVVIGRIGRTRKWLPGEVEVLAHVLTSCSRPRPRPGGR